MSIIAHLRQVLSDQIKGFEKNPSSAYDLILGRSLPSVRNTAQEVQAWKARNALTLLKVIKAGKLENLKPEDRLLFDKAHNELTDISRKEVLQGIASLQKKSQPREKDLCLEKSWHGIHYVLTGLAEGGRTPLSWAVLGDKEIPDPEKLLGYGPARFLTPKQVVSVTKALMSFSEKKFRQRFKPKEMEARKVYGVSGSRDLGYLWGHFQQLKDYYSQAVKRRCGMLCYFD